MVKINELNIFVHLKGFHYHIINISKYIIIFKIHARAITIFIGRYSTNIVHYDMFSTHAISYTVLKTFFFINIVNIKQNINN